jgi:REP element-mobilizing transposase RayT
MNQYHSQHHRRSIRLKGYDYSQTGYYFITLCTRDRQCWFGEVKNGKMYLNSIGSIVAKEWLNSAQIRQEIELDEWIVMPNHFHAIVIIHNEINENLGRTSENHIQGEHFGNIQGEHFGNIQGEHFGNIQGEHFGNIQGEHFGNIQGEHFGNIQGEHFGNIQGASLAPLRLRKPRSLSTLISGFKAVVTKRINEIRQVSGVSIWQRNYYEHIIRDELSLYNIRKYILENPLSWSEDPENPQKYSHYQTIDLDLPF